MREIDCESLEPVIKGFLAALKLKSPYTFYHSVDVANRCGHFCAYLCLSKSMTKKIVDAAYLHDIGKIGISDNILTKQSTLTNGEYEVIKNHSFLSARMLTELEFSQDVIGYVLHHHEFYNGLGYPYGLAKDEIPFGAKIISIVDAYSAMTSLRPYRMPMSKEEALGEIKRFSNVQFDPELVRMFIEFSAKVEGIRDRQTVFQMI